MTQFFFWFEVIFVFVLLQWIFFTMDMIQDSEWRKEAPLIVVEILNAHLFADNYFIIHVLQEILYSMAQNGSLLGLTSLLLLVLVSLFL